MSFNKNHWWFNGNDWEFIIHMCNERLYQIDTSLMERGWKSNKIRVEINRRKNYRNSSDIDVIRINKCTNLNKKTAILNDKQREEINTVEEILDNIIGSYDNDIFEDIKAYKKEPEPENIIEPTEFNFE